MSSNPNLVVLANGVTLHLDLEEGRYRGLGGASLNGTIFLVRGRNTLPFFRTEKGISYTDFRLIGQGAEREGHRVELEAIGRRAPVGTDVDLFDFPCIAPGDGEVRDHLTIFFAPKTVRVAGEVYHGFSIVYEWQSTERQIHWLYESVALAPGGTVAGARLMAQNMTARVCRLEEVLQPESVYSTEENYDVTCIQSPCRGGGSQFFDLVQGDQLAVVTFFEEFPSEGVLKSNCQKAKGEDFVTVSDFHYGPLSGTFRSAPRIIVAAPRLDSSRGGAVNRWTAWFDFTADLWCSHLKLPRTRSIPMLTFEGTGIGGIDPGAAYPELLETWASRLDWVVAQGFKAINLHTPEWVGAANRRTTVFGGNNCCPWEFKLSDQLGGEEGLADFCEACHARGLKVIIWIAGHLHREAPIWKKHPEWAVRKPDHGLWDGHYAVIHSLSFTSEAREWIFKDLKNLREKTGVDGIWFDSFTNLSYGALNWQSPRREPNGPAVLGFLSDLGKIGYEIMIECMTQLGVSSWGNLSPEQITGQEELLLNSSLRYYASKHWLRDPALTRDLYFRMLAARAPIGVWAEEFVGHPEPFPLPLPEWFTPLTQAFNSIEPRMCRRLLVPEGVLWLDEQDVPAALFGTRNGVSTSAVLNAVESLDLISGSAVSEPGPIRVQSGCIYRLNTKDGSSPKTQPKS